ncbi:DNA-binding helix-turn-helix domain protein [Bacteriovorax sp. BSW11_IV]|uniref:XRE family transcriptional regulator n=1 Tax=Bacteriovorax sp. BSW11_IV TaxID=1353529 RepID=UPI00038A5151|nr:XRE family transcriptional regulator [Bacteriovorax sp. BSW11_IV]EQC45083.1 DNA-binding helix-turn-helix domain protein [Bacteriovorax sp. BSW11_IV]
MSYSNEDILKRISNAKKNKSKLTHVTNKASLSVEDKVKMGLCKHFVQFSLEKKMLAKNLSDLTGIPTSRISEITNYKINKFTVDQLLKYLTVLGKHSAKIRQYLTLIEQIVEVPTLKVNETKKLSREIKSFVEAGANSTFQYV